MTDAQPSDQSAPDAAYDRWAVDYREWWAPVIAPSAIRLLDRLHGLIAADRPATIVDIGAGTGTLSLAALRRWPRVRVIGVDPARRMLEMAGEQARDAGLGDRFMTEIGEAARLPVADGTVDGAMCSFVLQLLPNRSAGVREAFRVLRPGSPFAALTWRADEDPWEVEDAFDDALDALRIEPPVRPDGEGRAYTSPEMAAAGLRRAGFRSVQAREEWLEHRFTPESYLDVAEHWTEEDAFAIVEEPMRARLRAEVVRRLEASSGRPRLAASARQRRRDPSGLRGLLAFAPQANRTTKRPIRDPPSHSSPAAAIGRSICAPAPVFVTVTCSPAQTRA